jgi:hypothetical protein
MDTHTNPYADDARTWTTSVSISVKQMNECQEHMAQGKQSRFYVNNVQGIAYKYEATTSEIAQAYEAGYEAAHRCAGTFMADKPMQGRDMTGIRNPMGFTEIAAFKMGIEAFKNA